MKNRGYSSAYFGFTDDEVEGNWNWVNGASPTYINWAPGEPSNGVNNNSGRENYGMFYWKFRYTWNDGDFRDIITDNGSQAFLVEWDSVGSSSTQGLNFNNNNTSATITSGYKKPVFSAADYSSLVTLDASSRKSINLIGNTNNNVIIGSIENDTLTGGKGNDTFVYSGGNDFDIIADYTEGEDIVSIGANSISGGMVVGSDVIFAIGNGGLKLLGAKDKTVTIYSGGTATEHLNPGAGETVTVTVPSDPTIPGDPEVNWNGVTVTLEADRTANFSLSSYNTTTTLTAVNVDGSLVRNSIYIYGDDEANIIRGTRSNTTIRAGKGNDVIYCGTGYDTIQYYTGDGNDAIYNYGSNDFIRLYRVGEYDETKLKNVVLNDDDVILNLTDGSAITLKDAKDKKVQVSLYAYDYDSNSGNWQYYNKTFGQVTISGASGTATLDAAYEGTFIASEYALNPANVDASSVRASIYIYGDSRANEIHGTRANTTIRARGGNDTIYSIPFIVAGATIRFSTTPAMVTILFTTTVAMILFGCLASATTTKLSLKMI